MSEIHSDLGVYYIVGPHDGLYVLRFSVMDPTTGDTDAVDIGLTARDWSNLTGYVQDFIERHPA